MIQIQKIIYSPVSTGGVRVQKAPAATKDYSREVSGHNIRKEAIPRTTLKSRVIKSGKEAGWLVKVDDGKRLLAGPDRMGQGARPGVVI